MAHNALESLGLEVRAPPPLRSVKDFSTHFAYSNIIYISILCQLSEVLLDIWDSVQQFCLCSFIAFYGWKQMFFILVAVLTLRKHKQNKVEPL